MFDTHQIRFFKRTTFNLALEIVSEDEDTRPNDVDHSDMILTWNSKWKRDSAISDLSCAQIWDKPSFKGAPDWEHIKD